MIERDGVEALSMRALGKNLGVEAASLYEHIRSRDDLLDAVADLVLEEFQLPPLAGDWKSRLRSIAFAWAELARRYPQSFRLLYRPSRAITSNDLVVIEQVVAALADAGFDDPTRALALRTYLSFVDGVLLRSASGAYNSDDSWRRAAPADPASFPGYVAVSPLAQGLTDDAVFAAGVDALIAGIAGWLEG